MDEKQAEAIYKEYMAQARHAEQQRLTFSTIFAAIFGGALAYVTRETVTADQRLVVFTFLTLFAGFGFMITAVWNTAFVLFSRLAERIAIDHLALTQDIQRFSRHKKILSAAKIFIGFYSLMVGLSIAMLIPQEISFTLRLSVMATIAFLLVLIYILWMERRINNIDRDHRAHALRNEST